MAAGPEPGYAVWSYNAEKKIEILNCRYICLATPADDALRLMVGTAELEAESPTPSLPREASNIMSQIKYETAVSVAHTDSRLLPVNRNMWCTYNIVVHDPCSVALKPYVINYVANRHQNDGANEEFNKFGSPEFFLSVNPHMPVIDKHILKDENGEPAVANLKHFVFDFDCMQAQADIAGPQQHLLCQWMDRRFRFAYRILAAGRGCGENDDEGSYVGRRGG
ncbi:hypothetical protein Z946_2394 [Sulfitobacter noctilucicola]|uniref:Putative NAD/FAD-binding protein n=1 Tax=Sulfitobacter noctilucicola TaxID=1342301 RepID=A0A7W6Q579_9RHOB|nr:hypothetical protein [Sulfitobacter noctilucicola]KIN63522.1 hypothetical protein Z946_2394 [Sulfitobacter noctilucicola]MBB4174969.1 putative NAD/FAD-binding protein [Sulfitobacter noctilucicola]